MTEPVRSDALRVSDVEREAVADQLRQAQAVGQIDIHEFDERVQSVWAARTRGELSQVMADLPAPPAAVRPAKARSRRPVFSDTDGGMAMRVLTIIWLSITALNVVVWGLVSVTSAGSVYPWPIWMAPLGAVLLVLYLAGIGRPSRE